MRDSGQSEVWWCKKNPESYKKAHCKYESIFVAKFSLPFLPLAMPWFPPLLLFPLNSRAGQRQQYTEKTARPKDYYPKRDSLHMVTHIPEYSRYRTHARLCTVWSNYIIQPQILSSVFLHPQIRLIWAIQSAERASKICSPFLSPELYRSKGGRAWKRQSEWNRQDKWVFSIVHWWWKRKCIPYLKHDPNTRLGGETTRRFNGRQ
jgi:hypothetical protein